MNSIDGVRELYERRWMLSTLPMALLIVAMLVASGASLDQPLTLVWLQFVIYLLHEFEEHVLPGGFKEFVNEHVAGPMLRKRMGKSAPKGDFPLDDPAVFWINILFIWIVFPGAAILASRDSLAWGALLPAIGIVNATLHVLLGIVLRRYNPGLAVSVFLNIPTGIWTLAVLRDAGVGTGAMTAAVATAVLLHVGLILWMSIHVRRALR